MVLVVMEPWLLLPIYLLVGWLTGKILNKYAAGRDDTFVPGFPLVGHAVALGQWGVSYLHACRKKVRGGSHCSCTAFPPS